MRSYKFFSMAQVCLCGFPRLSIETPFADVDRNIGNEEVAIDGFQEAIKLLDSLIIKSEEVGLEQRRLSVLEFLKNQLAE
ncbi:Protein NCA1 [Camellia lanceoleosa]|uniref:Protein NCA1 n=1 Tax=Camellia lanceoleosa TaxID=1840588 RepID=A0ACC0IU24_9ERIC|nr:Protein NCA1 [Camellia lanceoleosa]